MNQYNIYVKGITSNVVACYLLPDTTSQQNNVRIQARFKIHEDIHNQFMESCLYSPYLIVIIEKGMIVGVKNTEKDLVCVSTLNIEERIYSIVKDCIMISKKDLFAMVATECNVSTKTVQRKLKDAIGIYPDLRENYNNVWIGDKKCLMKLKKKR